MQTQHTEATHLIDGILPLKQTERGIFRLDSTGEWVRSNIAPDELKYTAKRIEDQNTPEEPKKPKRDQYLDKLNRLFNEMKTIINEEGEKTTRSLAKQLGTSSITVQRLMLMHNNKLTAEEAYDKLPAPSNLRFKAS